MSVMGRKQYELLTEATGLGLRDVRKRESKIMENAAQTMIDRIASSLKYDNDGFDIKQFKEGVESVAELGRMTDAGIH